MKFYPTENYNLRPKINGKYSGMCLIKLLSALFQSRQFALGSAQKVGDKPEMSKIYLCSGCS